MAPSIRPAGVREQLLLAAIDVFGRYGYAGTTTRMLSRAAGVNLQAIAYHFGGKEGLYLAAADHIAERMQGGIGAVGARAGARVAQAPERPLGVDEARALLTEILETMAGLLFTDEMTAFSRFIVREQMEPTEAFDRIYGKVMRPQLDVMRVIVGFILGEEPDGARVRLRTLSLVGSVLFLRVAHATVVRQLGWRRTGPRQLAAIKELVRDSVAAVGAGSQGRTPK